MPKQPVNADTECRGALVSWAKLAMWSTSEPQQSCFVASRLKDLFCAMFEKNVGKVNGNFEIAPVRTRNRFGSPDAKFPNAIAFEQWLSKLHRADQSGSKNFPREIKGLWHLKAFELENRTAFRLESGAIGLTHYSAQAGDDVVFVAGCKLPLILPPVEGGCHQLVAPAWINESIHQEFWTGECCIEKRTIAASRPWSEIPGDKRLFVLV
jgi:hypothetical protein